MEDRQLHKLLLRQKLASFLGSERYAKFIQRLWLRRDRLLYWQEQAWERFVETHPECRNSEAKLRELLRICWVHGGEELLAETVTMGDRRMAADYFLITGGIYLPTTAKNGQASGMIKYEIQIGSERSPCAETTEVIRWTEDCPFPPCDIVVWYCPECRRVYANEDPEPTPEIDWASVKAMMRYIDGLEGSQPPPPWGEAVTRSPRQL